MKAVSGKAMAKIFERKGCYLDRIRGSHHIYKKPGVADTASIPIHRNVSLKIGLQRQLMKLAEIEERDL